MKFLNSKIFTVLVGAIASWLTISSVGLNSQRDMVEKEVKNVETKIKNVQDDMDYFNKLSSYFQTQAFLEKEARSKLNYKVQGEEVVFIYKDKNVKNVSSLISFEELMGRMQNYKKWWYYLIGY